jgi:hypothetical protein
MSLTTRQKITLYSVLGIPFTPHVERLVDRDNILAQTYQPAMGTYHAGAKIEARLLEVAANAELEADLQDCLDKWYGMFGDSTKMDSGATGATSGVSFDLNRERAMYRERILAIVPFSREYMDEELGRSYRERLTFGITR